MLRVEALAAREFTTVGQNNEDDEEEEGEGEGGLPPLRLSLSPAPGTNTGWMEVVDAWWLRWVGWVWEFFSGWWFVFNL